MRDNVIAGCVLGMFLVVCVLVLYGISEIVYQTYKQNRIVTQQFQEAREHSSYREGALFEKLCNSSIPDVKTIERCVRHFEMTGEKK